MKETAQIQFRPVCSNCLKLITETVDCMEYEAPPNNKTRFIKEYNITPEACPYCGARFDCIEIPTKLPFRGLLEEI